ncbi:MAG: elongation factor P maturation arginine rhamnosyltransferase EarP [Pseudomonadota bacterium]
MPIVRKWDIFCNVIDNYGDIGVCWRLARLLAAEHGIAVRLWVDDLATLQRLAPAVTQPDKSWQGVEIRRWCEPFPAVEPAEVVIEAFACELPESYITAMAARQPVPIWLNLEYLSAEPWINGCHGLASPHPRMPLTKYFFFPGFTANSGGLLREHDLLQRRAAFCSDADAQAAFWRSLGLAPVQGAHTISLFGYENHALSELLDAWASGETLLRCLVPQGTYSTQLAAYCGHSLAVGESWCKGNLDICLVPFVEQTRYDLLLWACDLNFVRGEDSFVRAQWAGKPMSWQIYPQAENAHWRKLEAFLDLYCTGLPADAASACRAFWSAWNRQQGVGEDWPSFWQQREVLGRHALSWAQTLAKQSDLAASLVSFCQNRV